MADKVSPSEADFSPEQIIDSPLEDDGVMDGADEPSGPIQVKHRFGYKYHTALKTFIPVRYKKNVKQELPMTSSAGLLSFATYSWLSRLMWETFKSKSITQEQLWRCSRQDSADTNGSRFSRLWQEEMQQKGYGRASVVRVMLRFVRTRLVIAVFLCLISVLLSLVISGVLIRFVLEYSMKRSSNVGYAVGLVVGIFIADILRSLTFVNFWGVSYIAGARVRSGVLTTLYQKLLKVRSLQSRSVGEIVNLYSNDAQRIFDAISSLPALFAGPVYIVLVIIYCVVLVGPWAILGCAVLFLYLPCQIFLAKLVGKYRKQGIKITDERVRQVNEVLENVKLIKMYAWEEAFINQITGVRHKEKGVLEKLSLVQSMTFGIIPIIPILATVLTLIGHTMSGNDITAPQAFTLLAIYNSTRFILGILPHGMTKFSEMMVSAKRIKNLLLLEEMQPHQGQITDRKHAVVIRNATFSWDKNKSESSKTVDPVKSRENSPFKTDETAKMIEGSPDHTATKSDSILLPVLYDIDLVVQMGQLVGVCGSVGSGKSSLLSAILGRLSINGGEVGILGRIVYVGQQPWILNNTLRENILFGMPYVKDRYDAVINACCLKPDIDLLPSGDLTEIGEKGVNLSGGQCQRVSLARAVYSDRDIYLLDDPFASVDVHVGQHLFKHCIKGALSGKTVLLVSHQLQYLNQCSSIIMLKLGRILERGTHNELIEADGEYASLLKNFYTQQESPKKELLKDKSVESNVSMEKAVIEMEQVPLEEVATPDSDEDRKEMGKLIQKEEKQEGGMTGATYKAYFGAGGGIVLSVFVFLWFLINMANSLFCNWWLAYWLNQGSGGVSHIILMTNTTNSVVTLPPNENFTSTDDGTNISTSSAISGATYNSTTIVTPYLSTSSPYTTSLPQQYNVTVLSESITENPHLQFYTTIYGVSLLALLFTTVVRCWLYVKATLWASSSLHDKVLYKILSSPMSFFDTTPIGRIVNRISKDVDEVDFLLPSALQQAIINGLLILLSLLIIPATVPWFLVALLPLIIFLLFLFVIFRVATKELKRLDNILRSPLVSHLTSSVQGMATIHAYNKQEVFVQRFKELLDQHSVPYLLFFTAIRWSGLRLDLITNVTVTVTAALVMFLPNHISPAMGGLALAYAAMLCNLLQFMVRNMLETEARFTSVERINHYIKNLESESVCDVPLTKPRRGWPEEGAVNFNNYSMRYREGLTLALRDVTFQVHPKEKIGIVGRTGSGKSSLSVAVFRLVEGAEGSITIDGCDISKLALAELRSRLSVIPQDPTLFLGTVRYNLDPFNQHTDEELWQALEKCRIKSTIKNLADQLDEKVEENGDNFSAGEKQLLCLARAVLRKSKILILDEATAAIDTETDAFIQTMVREVFSDCTTLTVAHRLNTVMDYDRILVLENGKVVEFDAPSVLLEDEESRLSLLVHAAGSKFSQQKTS